MCKSIGCLLLLMSPVSVAEEYWIPLDLDVDTGSVIEAEAEQNRSRSPVAWLLSGKVKSSLNPGLFRLQYYNIAPGWYGKKWARGLRLALGVEVFEEDSESVQRIQQPSLLGAFQRQNRQSETVIFMSIGKSWH